MFTTEKELSKLTGLNHEQLWDSGFDLDDWDIGFQSDKPLPEYNWLRNRMDSYCVGYNELALGGKWYYLVYHA